VLLFGEVNAILRLAGALAPESLNIAKEPFRVCWRTEMGEGKAA
jgi:hypothetical protein